MKRTRYKWGPIGICTDDRYRSVPEARIIEMLMLVGWAYELESAAAVKAAEASLESWIQIGLAFIRGTSDERLFDPVEVINFMKLAGLEGRDNFWAERFIRTCRRLATDLVSNGSSLPNRGERRFEVDFRRSFNLRSIEQGKRLRLRAPLPLEGDYLRHLQVAPFADHGAPVEVRTGRLEARTVAAGGDEMTVGAKLCFSASCQAPCPGQSAEQPDRALYLRQREGLIVVSERISALALALAGSGTTSLEAVRAFWDYINRELICGMLHYDQIDAASPCDWLLDSGWFDCQMGSALLVSLCRARGIPARLVGGYLLYRLRPGNHYWAEVWIENQGWTPFDFFTWDLSQGGRDLEWRDYYFGRIDYRLTCERLPSEFTGSLGIPIPQAWCLLQLPRQGGLEILFQNINGTPVYSDMIHVA
jgi:hypothetical protein